MNGSYDDKADRNGLKEQRGFDVFDGPPPNYARRRFIAGLGVASLGAAAFGLGRRTSAPGDSTPVGLAPPTTTGSLSIATTIGPVTPPPVPPDDATVPLTRQITDGMAGDDVKMIQTRLKELAYDPGEIDGIFGLQTRQSSWAFQKLVLGTPRTDVDDSLTNELWSQMQQPPLVVAPRRADRSAVHVEVYLPEQVLVVFDNDVPTLITHISSGSGEDWCEVVTIDPGEQGNEEGTEPLEKGICGKSLTTGGTFVFNRRYVEGDGWREGSLGRMFKPVYFNYGLAVHGSSNVPEQPASHGCIRTPMHIAEYFPDLVDRGDDIWVWDGEHEPEFYGPQQPYFDRRDPDWIPPPTTTTSTTSTTVPGSSVPRPTTPATTTPATSAPPATSVAGTTVPVTVATVP